MFLIGRAVGARALLLTIVAAAVFATGCGGSDGSGGGSNDATAAAGDPTPERQVASFMREMTGLYNRAEAKRFCANLTTAGREEIVNAGRDVETSDKDCDGIMKAITDPVAAGDIPPRIVEVRRITVSGDRARVVIKGGIAGIRSVVPYRLVRRGGEWRLDDPVSSRSRLIRVEASPARPN